MTEKSSFHKRFQEWAAAHGLWWLIRGDKLLDRLQEWLVGRWTELIGSGTLATLSTWLIATSSKLHGVYLIWIAMASFIFVLFIWDLAVHGGRVVETQSDEIPKVSDTPEATTPSYLEVHDPTHVLVPPGMLTVVYLSVRNSLKEDITLNNLQAKIRFTHLGDDDKTVSGLFCDGIGSGRCAAPTTSITLNMSDTAVLIVLAKNIDKEFYIVIDWYSPSIPRLIPENKLSYGTWNVNVTFKTPSRLGEIIRDYTAQLNRDGAWKLEKAAEVGF